MSGAWIDRLARGLATTLTTRRGLAGLGAGGVAATALGVGTGVADAACRAPKQKCTTGKQCCTGKCKRGKCATCANGATFVDGRNPVCWLSWGSFGSGDGQFFNPSGVAVGSNGHVYVAEQGNHRIQEFDATGAFVRKWGKNGGDGAPGSGDGEFDVAAGVAVAGGGLVYVADFRNHRMQEFDARGGFVRKWGSNGSSDGQFNFPFGVAVGGPNGHVYVADAFNHRMQEFDATGAFVRTWGSFGSGDGQFNTPFGVAVRGNGHVYVAERDNHRIQEFDATLNPGDPGFFVRKWGSFGSGNGQFSQPHGVAVRGGHVYVADRDNHRIQEFDATGGFVRKWGGQGSGDGQFAYPAGVAVGGNGQVYVADTSNHRIVRLQVL